jgi:Uma2 family endonuclease
MKPYVSYEDYFAAEQTSDVKHEWFDGSVYAMSRSTPEHARLSARIMAVLGNKLSTYADASVVCGPLETITVRRNGKSLGQGVTNPAVIVEVLSESTERYDCEEKFAYYRTLPSLRDYVLICQDERTIEVFRRPTANGQGSAVASPSSIAPLSSSTALRDRWEYQVARAGGAVTIHGRTIEVDAVYGVRD